MPPLVIRNQRIPRARPEDDDVDSEVFLSDEIDETSGEESDRESELDDVNDSVDRDGGGDMAESSDASDGSEDVQSPLSKISFGALASAQSSLGKRKRSGIALGVIGGIGAQIREAREQQRRESGTECKNDLKLGRPSKNAPMVQSSKHAVTRKRIVVEAPNAAKSRDPRFDPAVLSHSATKHNPTAINHAYAFLDDYRVLEIKQLKEQLASTKDPVQREELKRTVTSMTDRQRALENKKRGREALSDHRRRERQLLREGKKSRPWYLKKSDLKREVLTKKYESMGAKEKSKALVKRRKKLAAKERKEMPSVRRTLDVDADAGGTAASRDSRDGHRRGRQT